MTPETTFSVLSGQAVRSVRASVVIPCYERTDLLGRLLDSLVSQQLEHGTFEVVLSDDGSGPAVLALAEAYAPRFHRLVLVRGPNSGPGVARNRGVTHALASVIAFIDSDCVASTGWLERVTRAVEGGAAMTHGPVASSLSPMEPFVHSFQVGELPVPGANLAVSRESFERVGGFRAEISRIAEDHDLVGRYREAGYAPVFTPDAIVVHPPTLKRISASVFLAPAEILVYQQLANFYRASPDRRRALVRVNRTLVTKAICKVAILLGPVFFLPSASAAAGIALLWGIALRKWWMANRALRRAGESIRVPFREGARYALLLPVHDLFTLAHRARFGLLRLR